jgi:hypothetical protein
MVHWLAPMHHNYQSSLPSEEVDQELEESINSESLLQSVIVPLDG